MTSASKNRFVSLSNDKKMPLLGLGTWKSKPGEVKDAVIAAIDAGYRHIDCAYLYQNENEIGEALKEVFDKGSVKREDVFITTKLWGTFFSPERVQYCLRLSLKALQLEYIDLYLMHSPMAAHYVDDTTLYPRKKDGSLDVAEAHYMDTWKAIEALVERGLAKSVGVSNFTVTQLGEVLKATKVPCVVNQIENHPFLDQKEVINFCKSKNVTVTAYSPLGSPDRPWASEKDPSLLKHPVVIEMSKVKNCTPGQTLIAYNLQQGLVCIPKSVTPSRIQENFLALDVKLTDEDVKKLDDICCNFRACTWALWKDHIHYPFGELQDS